MIDLRSCSPAPSTLVAGGLEARFHPGVSSTLDIADVLIVHLVEEASRPLGAVAAAAGHQDAPVPGHFLETGGQLRLRQEVGPRYSPFPVFPGLAPAPDEYVRLGRPATGFLDADVAHRAAIFGHGPLEVGLADVGSEDE